MQIINEQNNYKYFLYTSIVTILLSIFPLIYPPVNFFFFQTDARIIRIFIELLTLVFLFLSLKKEDGNLLLLLGVSLILYCINYLTNSDHITKVFSHFVKLCFLILFPVFLSRNDKVKTFLRFFWISLWSYFSLAAILGCLLFYTGTIDPVPINGLQYDYKNYYLLGNFLTKDLWVFLKVPYDTYYLLRYTGFLEEPVILSFFFGLNIICRDMLIDNPKNKIIFFLLNVIGGLLTYSFSFYLFLPATLIFNRFNFFKKTQKPIYLILLFFIIILASPFLIEMIMMKLTFSSFSDRYLRYMLGIDFIKNLPLIKQIFGSGIIYFHETIERGAASAFVDILASRGLLIFSIWLFLLINYGKTVKGLILFIVLYSSVYDFWHFPLFIMSICIITSLSHQNNQLKAKESYIAAPNV